MCIDFVCKTNKDYVMINVAKFQYPDGREVIIERGLTKYVLSTDGTLNMSWHECYFWDGNSAKPLERDDYEELNTAKLVELEVEEDADADYRVDIVSFHCFV